MKRAISTFAFLLVSITLAPTGAYAEWPGFGLSRASLTAQKPKPKAKTQLKLLPLFKKEDFLARSLAEFKNINGEFMYKYSPKQAYFSEMVSYADFRALRRMPASRITTSDRKQLEARLIKYGETKESARKLLDEVFGKTAN